MAFTHQNIIYEYGFQTKWELDKFIFTEKDIISTEPKAVDGMPDVKWYLKCEPAVGLFRKNCRFHVNIDTNNEVKFEIDAQIGKHEFPSKEKSCNKNYQILFADILDSDIHNPAERYFQNNKLMVYVRGRFSYTHQSTKSIMNRHAAKWGLQLKEAFPFDFKIIVEDKEIQITKRFLSIESSVFARMFESNFKEAQENRVSIPEFKYKTVQAAVDYCYAQNISAFLDQNENKNIIDLLYFCNKYDFKTLKPELEELLASKISVSNVANFVSIADKANSPKLRQTCINFVRSLFNSKPSWNETKLSDFDADFIKDVFASSLNIQP